jgi:manganese transport protein
VIRLKIVKQLIRYLGPAFIISVAYIDPGNFATNISGGSQFNYDLLWVILFSNLTAIFLQSMSAKLGIATNKNLSQLCKNIFSNKVNWGLWIIAELSAIATFLAEFMGGTLGFYLLFNMPMIYAGILTIIITIIINNLEKYGQRVLEIVIISLVAVITLAYGLEIFIAKPDWLEVGRHTLIPSLKNKEAIMIAVGMLGATVMPHVIYLHSQLVQHRNKNDNIKQKKHHLKMEKIDICIAMNIAFVINAAMIIVSAAVFYKNNLAVDTIENAHKSLQPLLGSLSSSFFAIALLASGLSSSAVGNMANQTIISGFVDLKIPSTIKKLITIIPAIIIIILNIEPMKVLLLSQVFLSFALPFTIIPMLIICNKKKIMHSFVNKTFTNIISIIITISIILLNAILILSILF